MNAKYHEQEALIIAQAGREGAVTVATNMAGRGTDIMLGGNPPDEAEHERVVKNGGLAIIGTERHESRRIDNQLRGRSGRQGDPGASRFYLSLEDNLLRLFGSDRIQPLMGKLGMKNGEAIESSMLTRIIENSQKKVEELHFDIRKQLLAYDNVMNQQREAIYSERESILSTPIDEVPNYGWDIFKGVINDLLDKYFPDNSNCEPERAAAKLKSIFGPGAEGKIAKVDNRLDMEGMKQEIIDGIQARYNAKVAELETFHENAAAEIVSGTLLYVLDNEWREHLTAMDELRRGIGLRAIGQKDPLIEYQFESYNLFQEMMDRVKTTFCDRILRSRIINAPEKRELENLQYSKPELSSTPRNNNNILPGKKEKIGRNDPCPCGSGKKYKYCHGRGL